jgi:peptide/nickel transport system substrate-binding protein
MYDIPLTAGAYVFFKSSNPVLGDVKVRQALVAAANRGTIINSLGFSALPVDEPLLHSQFAYDPQYAQITNQPAEAKTLLHADGWQLDSKGIREKSGQPLSFALSVMDGTEYVGVAQQLANEWKVVGIDVKVDVEQPASFQGTLAAHAYDAVLYGISIGVDPDVFVYWDSSQADIRSQSRLNFAEYKSTAADAALEAGRTRLDQPLRVIKYRTFLQAWQQDAPALGLYQPRLLYVSHIPVYGLDNTAINTNADHFDNVQDWMVHVAWVTR